MYRAAVENIARATASGKTPPAPVTPNPLKDSSWILQLFEGKEVEGNYSLAFTDTNLSAKFCNTLAGIYTLDNSTINAHLIQTQMACLDEESMALENQFNLDSAVFTIASTKMPEANIERLAILTSDGNSFVRVKEIALPEEIVESETTE